MLAILTDIVQIFNPIFNTSTKLGYLTIFMYAFNAYAVSYYIVSLRLKLKGYCIIS